MNKFLKLLIICLFVNTISLLSACGVSYTLYFDSNGGSEIASVTTDGNSVIAIPQNPTKEGYEFDGWYWDNATFLKPFTANSLLDAPLSSDMTIYAKWKHSLYENLIFADLHMYMTALKNL